MAGGVEEDAERLPGLVLRLGRPDRQHRLLTGIEVGHVEVEVQLLGMLAARPVRWPVVLDALEGDRRPVRAVELGPLASESAATVQPVRSL